MTKTRRLTPVAHTFAGLDTLRAVGALAVVTTHAAFWAGDYTRHGWAGTLMSRLDAGVAVFFVLSGFLLSRPWLVSAAHGGPRPGTLRYAWKRLLRIAPVYVVTVVIAYLFIEANADRGPRDLTSTLLLVDVYHQTQLPDGLTQMWSLAVEVAFYLVLPVLMPLLVGATPRWRPWRLTIGLALCCTTAVVWWSWAAFRIDDEVEAMPLQWLPGYLTWFAIGIALAGVQVRSASGASSALTRLLGRMAARPGAMWVTAVGLLMVSATPVAGPALLASPTPEQALTKNLLYAGVAALITLPSVLGDPSTTYARAMSTPVARHLGVISYSLFCIHLPVLHLVMWITGWTLFGGRGLEIWLLTVAISLPVSELLYRLVELPAMRLRNLGRRRTPDPERTSSPTRGGTSR